jgi:serine/threonine protein kinase
MEYCENTFDDLILSNDLKPEEWFSAFMQIIMILITYQKAFSFTHNDLHSNNVMYNHTDKKYIYYCYKKQNYKVPTFGRIFKIIDFGRSIYKFDGKLFCSDSFQNGNDAATQYNTEPYFNEKKPRLEPNFSFDLCRLACSIFDYVVEDISEIKSLEKCDPVKKLIVEWCLDDKGINMLYKNNGIDRYPDFKLYKMIARCVHNHTPQAQLERPEFKAYAKFKGDVPSDVIDIDKIPVLI